jgi:hypothetical protein
VSVLDQATKQQITIFQANRSTSELALRTIHSDEYRQDFERSVIDMVIEALERAISEAGVKAS